MNNENFVLDHVVENVDPLIGWIKEAGDGFINDRDAFSVTEFSDIELRPSRIYYFKKYFEKYFNSNFIFGQGTEDILSSLRHFGLAGHWLDLGAGTTTLFWSIPLQNISSISCCDIVVEALAVLEGFARSEEVPCCYRQVLEMFGKPVTHLNEMRQRIHKYLIFDTLVPWPAKLVQDSYNLITAFGNFGIASTSERYAECFKYVSRYLARGGHAIGADWVRRASFIKADGHDNSYLSDSLITQAAQNAGLRILSCRQVAVAGDSHYRAVICWALEK